ncbi:Olfactory Receptor 2T27 [Manis pentadactyla]|nr:Olfactory Receptor 2T27 [Manis pentadactyla]
MFLFTTLVGSECLLLAVMAYDRYVASATYCTTPSACAPRQIHHFFCEIPALLKLVCTDTSQYEKGIFVSGLIFFLSPFSAILASYGGILFTVLGMGSSLGLRKALATCSSHMIVVSLFYGASIIKYFLPKSYHCPEQDEVLSAFYTILTSTLNPLIYSLWNSDVTQALQKGAGEMWNMK